MGNKLQRSERRRRSRSFFTSRTSTGSGSLTIPSMCTSPSFQEDMKKSSSAEVSDTFTWNQMKSLYMRQESLTIDNFTPLVLRMASTAIDVLKRQLPEICGDLNAGILRMPDGIADRFAIYNTNKSSNQVPQLSPSTTALVSKKMIVHFVTMVSLHELILNHFRHDEVDLALDLIKQVVVSHALMGVTGKEFRLMDWFLANYLYTNKISSDEVMNNLILYLNTFSNHIAQFFITQSIRYYNIDTLIREKKNDRENKARENFRLMKKWKKQLEILTGREQFVELLIEEQMKLRRTEEDQISIDTLTLKENDAIMKYFVTNTKRKESEFEKRE